MIVTIHDLDPDEWRRLCMRAFENLSTNTTVTMNDVDSILTGCLPEYDRIKALKENNDSATE